MTHALPHAPQLAMSAQMFTQAPGQHVGMTPIPAAGHAPPPPAQPQVPALHAGVIPEQALPQPPQFSGSLAVVTQLPPQQA